MPILKHRLKLEGISYVVLLVSFPDVKKTTSLTKRLHQKTIEAPKRLLLVYSCSLLIQTFVLGEGGGGGGGEGRGGREEEGL